MSEPARAIVHDQFRVMGGAERVACAMARLLDCPIYAGRVDDGVVPADVDVREVFDGRVGRRAMRSHYMVQDAYQMLAWQQQPALREYDTLVVNKTNPLWYVPQEHQTVVAYIHSTPRGLYDQFARSEYGIAKRGLKMWMRTLFETNRCTPDALACNSELVKRRIGLHWGRDDVACIHPPVDTDAFGQDAARGDGDYLFTVSRLHDHKRVDELVAAARQLDCDVIIAGDGPARERLTREAPRNVQFTGYVSDAEKAALLADAEAVWFGAENEDFGIVPIEALASGTPVIGVRDGYTQYQIRDGENGVLYDRGVDNLVAAIERFGREGVAMDAAALEQYADQFSAARFRERFYEWLRLVERTTGVDVTHDTRDRDGRERVPVEADGGESC